MSDQAETNGTDVITLPFGTLRGGAAFELWADLIGTVLEPDIAAEDVADFSFGLTGAHLGALVIGSSRSVGFNYRRTAGTIGRSGIDHYFIQINDAAPFRLAVDGRDETIERDDIWFGDLSRPVETWTGAFRNTSLVIPRAQLETLLDAPDDLHGRVIRAQSPLGTLLRTHVRRLMEVTPHLGAHEAEALVAPTLGLVAACAGLNRERRDEAERTAASISLARVRAHVDRRLGDPDLSPETICRDLGVSRSALYRMFEPLGGVAEHIRRRRLARAWSDLVSPAQRHLLISEIGYRWGFSSESSFSRAVRATYGVTPSALRRAGTETPPGRAAPRPGAAGEPRLGEWIRGLMHL